MKILSVTQLKNIEINGSIFPMGPKTKFNLDKKTPSNKKEHCLFFQQGPYYGEVGDICTYLNNEDLLDLENKGLIEIKKTNDNTRMSTN